MIDVHAHIGVPAAAVHAQQLAGYDDHLAAVARRYASPATAAYMAQVSKAWQHALTDRAQRLSAMAAALVTAQVLSVNPGQYYYWAEKRAASDLTEIINEHISAEVAARPDLFAGLGTVCLQHPELAADQLTRAVEHWGLAGIEISTQAAGRDLADPAFDPLWSAAESLDAVVFIHPLGCPQLADRLAPAYLANVAGQPLETTIALSLLIFSGVLDRHPRLRLCAAHGGGYLPHYIGRSERAYGVRPDSHTMERPPADYLRRLWFDSVVHAPDVLARLVAAVGASRVVIGTDYPFDMGDEHPARTLAGTGLPEPDRARIADTNALELLGSHASRLSNRPSIPAT